MLIWLFVSYLCTHQGCIQDFFLGGGGGGGGVSRMISQPVFRGIEVLTE